MTGDLLLGVDVGTASTKGVLATPEGEVVAEHEVPHELLVPQPGWAEHDAEASWCANLAAGTPTAGSVTAWFRSLLDEGDKARARRESATATRQPWRLAHTCHARASGLVRSLPAHRIREDPRTTTSGYEKALERLRNRESPSRLAAGARVDEQKGAHSRRGARGLGQQRVNSGRGERVAPGFNIRDLRLNGYR